MKKLVIALVCVALAVTLLGCSGAEKDTLTITLTGNPTTGYTWIYAIGDPSVLEEISNEYVADTEDLAGSGGVFKFTFAGRDSGESNVGFTYQREWENEQPIATVVYRVGVDGSGNVISCEEVSSSGDDFEANYAF